MCYPVPDCDPNKVHKPMLAATTEEDTAGRRDSYPYTFDQRSRRKQFSTAYHLPPNGNVPLFKSPPLDKDEQEDYDYGPTDFPETYPQPLLFPTQSSSSSKVISVFRDSDRSEKISAFQSFDRGSKLELIERYGVHDHPADKKEVTENPQSTVRPHTHEDTTTAWQHSQDLTSVRSVLFGYQSPRTDLENPLHAHSSLGSATFPLNQGLGGEKHPKDPHVISESAIHHSVTTEYHQNASDTVKPRGSNSQINVSHQVRGAESQTNQQSQSESNSQQELQGMVAPEGEEEVDADNREEEGEDEIVTFQSVTEPQGKDVPYKIKSAEQERSEKDSESSDPNSSYEMTTPEPSTSFPRGPEYHTTPIVPFIATATTITNQLPVRVKLNENQPSRKPGQRLFNLHSEDIEEVKEEEEGKDQPVLLIKPDEGELKDAFTTHTHTHTL